MTKLSVSGNSYQINNKKEFKGLLISHRHLLTALNFAYAMVYGSGHHKSVRAGGLKCRKKGEKFCNTFQGKLAEIVLHDYLVLHNIETEEPDFGIYGKGIWDDCDLMANRKRINVKSAASFSNLFLLETNDWNELGQYKPDLEIGKQTTFDFFVLVRFKPDLKSIFCERRLFYSDEALTVEYLKDLILNQTWFYDIAGCLSNENFIKIISDGYILPQGVFLNNHIKMDAENYYQQCGDMDSITELIDCLKQ